jgi:hypothetical protein
MIHSRLTPIDRSGYSLQPVDEAGALILVSQAFVSQAFVSQAFDEAWMTRPGLSTNLL